MDLVAWLLGAAGFALGLGADRLATRWPEHDEEHAPGRAAGWRTAVTALVGALALGLLTLRFGGDPVALVVFGAWFVTLIIGMATDLDQRLLPDVLTVPVIPVGLVYALSGANPLVGGEIVPAIAAAVLIPAVLYIPSIPFGAGAFGLAGQPPAAGISGWSARPASTARNGRPSVASGLRSTSAGFRPRGGNPWRMSANWRVRPTASASGSH